MRGLGLWLCGSLEGCLEVHVEAMEVLWHVYRKRWTILAALRLFRRSTFCFVPSEQMDAHAIALRVGRLATAVRGKQLLVGKRVAWAV